MSNIKITQKSITLKDKATDFFQKKITQFGNGAKIDCPKKHLGKKAYIIITD